MHPKRRLLAYLLPSRKKARKNKDISNLELLMEEEERVRTRYLLAQNFHHRRRWLKNANAKKGVRTWREGVVGERGRPRGAV